MYNSTPIISKVVNAGLVMVLTLTGMNPAITSAAGQVAEGLINGFSDCHKSNLLEKYLKALRTGFKSALEVMQIELDYPVSDAIVENAFSNDNLVIYVNSGTLEPLVQILTSQFDYYDIPYVEQNISIAQLASVMLSKIEAVIFEDPQMMLLSLHSYAENSYLVISDIKLLLEKISRYIYISDNQINMNSRKEDLVQAWNSEVFLHRNSNVRLRDLFVDACYKSSLRCSSDNSIDKVLFDFLASDEDIIMLLQGNPGLGKSTLFCHWANLFYSWDNVVFIRFRDLDTIPTNGSILDAIQKYLGCTKKALERKILFIDGYDELNCTP